MAALPTLALAWDSQAGVFVTLTEASPAFWFSQDSPGLTRCNSIYLLSSRPLPLTSHRAALLSASLSYSSRVRAGSLGNKIHTLVPHPWLLAPTSHALEP